MTYPKRPQIFTDEELYRLLLKAYMTCRCVSLSEADCEQCKDILQFTRGLL